MTKTAYKSTQLGFSSILVVIVVIGVSIVFLISYLFQLNKDSKNTGSALGIESASLSVDAGASLGNWNRLERHNAEIHTSKGQKDIDFLKSLGTSMTRGFLRLQHLSSSKGVYNFAYDNDYSMYKKMLLELRQIGSKPLVTISGTPTWFSDPTYTGIPDATQRPPTLTALQNGDYEKFLYDVLKYYKTNFPEIEYVEYWNEPDLNATKIDEDRFNLMYKAASNVVKKINGEGVSPKIRLGGPTLKEYNVSRLTNFITYAKTNALLLDFLSWHDYHHDTNPAYFKTEMSEMRKLLTDNGFSSAKIFITEWQYDPGSPSSYSADYASKAATFAAAGLFYWVEGGLDFSGIFAAHDYANPHRAILAPGVWTGNTNLGYTNTDGVVHPVGNVLKLFSMLKDTRVKSTSSKLQANGQGLNSIATTDSNTVAVLAWNYNRTTSSDYSVSLSVNNLPSNLRNSTLKVERYLVGPTNSNYFYNTSKWQLEKVEEVNLTSATAVTKNFELPNYSVSLLVFTKASGTGVTPPPPTTGGTSYTSSIVEMENGSLSSVGVVKEANPAASNENNIYFTSNDGTATHSLSIPNTANYYFWIRVSTKSENDNSVYMRFNDGETYTVSLPVTSGAFQWYKATFKPTSTTGQTSYLTLPKGTVKMVTSNREIFGKLDAFVVTDDSAYVPPVIPVGTVPPPTPAPTTQSTSNVVLNPSFEDGTTNWAFYAWDDATSKSVGTFTTTTLTKTTGTKSAELNISGKGTNVQLYQYNLKLKPNTNYRLSFDAKSTAGRDMKVRLIKHSTPFTNYGINNYYINLTEAWKSFTIDFTTSGFTTDVSDGRLVFWLPEYAVAGDVYNVDNVVLSQR